MLTLQEVLQHARGRTGANGTLDDRLVSVTHYSGTPIAAENVSQPVLDWEKNFSEHGSLTGGPAAVEPAGADDLATTSE